MHWEPIGKKVELENGWYLTSESGDMEFETARVAGNTSTYYKCDVAMFEWSGSVLQFYASIEGETVQVPWWLLFDTNGEIVRHDTNKSPAEQNILIQHLTPDGLKYPTKFITQHGTITFNEDKGIVVKSETIKQAWGTVRV